MAEFSTMSLVELKEEAKKRGLKGISTMRKPELVELLSAQEKPARQPKSEVLPAEPVKAEPAAAEEPKAEVPADETRVQEERRLAMNAPDGRRPAPYQDRGQAAYGTRRPSPSYVQQPRPGYNAQQGYNTQNRPPQAPQPPQQQPQPQAQIPGDQSSQPKGPTAQDIAMMSPKELEALDSGETKTGILEIMPEGFGFIR